MLMLGAGGGGGGLYDFKSGIFIGRYSRDGTASMAAKGLINVSFELTSNLQLIVIISASRKYNLFGIFLSE